MALQKSLSENVAAHIMKQLLSAVAYCHAKKVVHRDLKPENLLLESKAKDAQLKVIDFGTSKVFDPRKKMTDKIGTPLYIAPEVLNQPYTEKCDVWSCGVVLYVLLSGKPPFTAPTESELLQRIRRGSYTMLGTGFASSFRPAVGFGFRECQGFGAVVAPIRPRKASHRH